MKIEQDKSAKSISFFNKQSVISKKQIFHLIRNKSKDFTLNCRLSINSSNLDNINCMMIFQKKNFIPDPKYYLKKDKIFFCNKGKMTFFFFDKSMNFLKKKKINKDEFIFIKKKTVYTNISIVPKTIHTEIISGPFIKKSRERIDLNFPTLKKKWLKNYLRNSG